MTYSNFKIYASIVFNRQQTSIVIPKIWDTIKRSPRTAPGLPEERVRPQHRKGDREGSELRSLSLESGRSWQLEFKDRRSGKKGWCRERLSEICR